MNCKARAPPRAVRANHLSGSEEPRPDDRDLQTLRRHHFISVVDFHSVISLRPFFHSLPCPKVAGLHGFPPLAASPETGTALGGESAPLKWAAHRFAAIKARRQGAKARDLGAARRRSRGHGVTRDP